MSNFLFIFHRQVFIDLCLYLKNVFACISQCIYIFQVEVIMTPPKIEHVRTAQTRVTFGENFQVDFGHLLMFDRPGPTPVF